MYISQLVKTRDLYPGLLINRHPVSFLPFSASLNLSSSSFHLSSLSSYLSSSLHLLLVHFGGSATMPSHIQRGPSVTIPSVRGS
jgi:hypothetical protein